MRPERVQIGGIPALLYGAPAERGYLFLHGQMGRKEEAEAFGECMARQGAEQCGYCSPGFIMTVLAMAREFTSPPESSWSRDRT